VITNVRTNPLLSAISTAIPKVIGPSTPQKGFENRKLKSLSGILKKPLRWNSVKKGPINIEELQKQNFENRTIIFQKKYNVIVDEKRKFHCKNYYE